jgi:ribonuclease HII
VAAASVIAKVARDRLMAEMDVLYPGYDLARNKGYAAPEHRAGLETLGLCPIHRLSFAPCRDREQMSLWEDAGADAASAIDEGAPIIEAESDADDGGSADTQD